MLDIFSHLDFANVPNDKMAKTKWNGKCHVLLSIQDTEGYGMLLHLFLCLGIDVDHPLRPGQKPWISCGSRGVPQGFPKPPNPKIFKIRYSDHFGNLPSYRCGSATVWWLYLDVEMEDMYCPKEMNLLMDFDLSLKTFFCLLSCS